jgi:hypothetical protein
MGTGQSAAGGGASVSREQEGEAEREAAFRALFHVGSAALGHEHTLREPHPRTRPTGGSIR